MPYVDAMDMAVHFAAFPPAHILLAQVRVPVDRREEHEPARPMAVEQIAAAFGGRVVSGGRRVR